MVKVELQLFQDDATGEYGLTHSNSIEKGFNACWDGKMIFHEIFEHYFEDIHPYFKGEYSFNVGGEMAAAGHYAYYQDSLCDFKDIRVYKGSGRYTSDEEMITGFTKGLLQSGSYIGDYCEFGDELLSGVPRQKNTEDNTFENYIESFRDIIDNLKLGSRTKDDDPEDVTKAIRFKKSIKIGKIKDLHRWGYNQAKKLCPYHERVHNGNVMLGFIKYWENFCKNNSAEDLYNSFDKLIFKYDSPKGKLKWKAMFRDKYTKELVDPNLIEEHLYKDY